MRKKLNIKLIVIGVIVFILLIVGLYLFFNTDFFRTKRSAFLRYFETIPDAFKILDDKEYGSYQDYKEKMPHIRKADMKIKTSSNVADSNILDKIKISLTQKVDYFNDKANMNISIDYDRDNLLDVSIIQNKNVYGFLSKDISNNYISIENDDLKRIAKDAGIENVDFIPNQIIKYNFKKIFETTNVEKDKLAECCEMIKNNVPDTAYTKERKKIKVNNESYSTTMYTLNLTAEENANLQIDILNKISQDSILMDYITSKCRLLNMNEEYTDLNTLNQLMKNRIQELQKNPQIAEELSISVYENHLKNIRTEIISGENKITIDHIVDGDNEYSSLKINQLSFSMEKKDGKKILSFKNEEDIEKEIIIEYTQLGSIENNDIRNQMTIIKNEGIKSVTYSYEDTINFTNDIGKIEDFSENQNAIINNFNDDEIIEFMKNFKDKINNLYISKGASIGINLDPIFE